VKNADREALRKRIERNDWDASNDGVCKLVAREVDRAISSERLRLRELECLYCKGKGVIEAECYPGGSFEAVLCPCGKQPADTDDDDDDLVDDPPPDVAP
jgi:hypothetical protein